MSDGFRKIWMYLIPLGLLAVVATCDTDFNMKNPFSDSNPKDTLEVENGVKDSMQYVTEEKGGQVDTVNLRSVGGGSEEYSLEKSEVPTLDDTSTKMWRLIVASVAEKQMAVELKEKYNTSIDIIYVSKYDTHRLVYGSYSNLGAAQQAALEIQDEFPEAWVAFF